MLYVYIAGPITKPDPKENTILAIRIADQLLDLGYAPFLPHLSVFWNEYGKRRDGGDYGKGYEVWMKWAFAWIRKCDCVLRIPGFSLGADREIEFAKTLGLPIFYSVEELEKSFL